jgi:hypothetical protein
LVHASSQVGSGVLGASGQSVEDETMLIAEARVETERPSRYLAQLCRHVEEMGEARLHMHARPESSDAQGDETADAPPRMLPRVEWSDTYGVVELGEGRCILRAESDALTLRAEAPDEKTLQSVQQRVAERLERFGRRDQLTVTWSSPQRADEQRPQESRSSQGEHA